MPLRTGKNYSRKQRRISKYGKFRRTSGGRSDITRGPKGRMMKIYRPLFPSPFKNDSEKVQLRYNQVVTLDPNPEAINGSNTWVFHANNLFDPDRTGTGNQPMYFDNYAQLYDRYYVSFAKIKCTIVNHGVNTAVWNGSQVVTQPNQSYRFAITRDANESDIPPSMDTLIMQNATNCKWRYVSPQLNGKLPSLSMKCAPHKQVGVAYADDTIVSNVSAGPSRSVFFRIAAVSADGTTDPPNGLRVQVQITYYVKFFDRKTNQPMN